MTYSIYIDVVFLINLVMDLIVLHTVRILLKLPSSRWRLAAGAAIGALWTCILVLCPFLPAWMEWVLTYVCISSLMVGVAFRAKGIRELIKGVLGLYLAAVTLGGTMYALYQHTRLGYYVELLIRGRLMEGMPLIILLLLAAGAYFANRYLWINLLEIRRQKNYLHQVTLTYGETVIHATGLLDTGNHLYEPLSHRPVHVVSGELWNRLEPPGELLAIPYHTIGTEGGFMSGMEIDVMQIHAADSDGGERIIKKPLIAVSPHVLSGDGSYEILLHEDN